MGPILGCPRVCAGKGCGRILITQAWKEADGATKCRSFRHKRKGNWQPWQVLERRKVFIRIPWKKTEEFSMSQMDGKVSEVKPKLPNLTTRRII